MHKIIVAGIGTEIGKTVVSAILTTLFQGDYWKPVQCGNNEDLDTYQMQHYLDTNKHKIHPPCYSLKAPLSPHAAAKLENITIEKQAFILPKSLRPLIIEGAGGVLTPFTENLLCLDVFQEWSAKWVIVSKHYLGSINHTLLTLEALKHRNISIAGLVFNGLPSPETEIAILKNSKLPLLGRVLPEPIINKKTIQKYATQWKLQFIPLIH